MLVTTMTALAQLLVSNHGLPYRLSMLADSHAIQTDRPHSHHLIQGHCIGRQHQTEIASSCAEGQHGYLLREL